MKERSFASKENEAQRSDLPKVILDKNMKELEIIKELGSLPFSAPQ
jgi:hypothetical protein